MGGTIERLRELRRRRKRRQSIQAFKRKLKKATASEKAVIAEKIWRMSPGAEQVLENLGLAGKGR